MAAPGTSAAIAPPILAVTACLYHRATHCHPDKGIRYSPHSTRRLLGGMPELAAEAQPYRDPAKMPLSQFKKLGSPSVQRFLMPFWRPLVYVTDAREIWDLHQSPRPDFNKSPELVRPLKPIVADYSLARERAPEWRAQVRLWNGIISVVLLRDLAAPIDRLTASELVETWRARDRVTAGKSFWARKFFNIAAHDVTCEVMLGSDVDAVKCKRETVWSALMLSIPTRSPR